MIHTACRFRTYDPIMFFLSPGWVLTHTQMTISSILPTFFNQIWTIPTSATFSTKLQLSQQRGTLWSIPVLVGCMNIGSNLYVLNDYYSIPIISLDSSLSLDTHLGFLQSPSHHRLKYTQMIEFWMKTRGTPILGILSGAFVLPHFQTDPGIKIRGSVGCEPISFQL